MDLNYLIKYYTCYTISQIFFFVGDMASKPMSWGWMDGEGKITEAIGSVNYAIYNWLMLKSVYFSDLGGCDVWTTSPINEDDEGDDNAKENDSNNS